MRLNKLIVQWYIETKHSRLSLLLQQGIDDLPHSFLDLLTQSWLLHFHSPRGLTHLLERTVESLR